MPSLRYVIPAGVMYSNGNRKPDAAQPWLMRDRSLTELHDMKRRPATTAKHRSAPRKRAVRAAKKINDAEWQARVELAAA